MSLNDQHIRNEQVKMHLKSQQDVNSLQINELKAQLHELQESLERKKEAYKVLKREIKQLDEQTETLK